MYNAQADIRGQPTPRQVLFCLDTAFGIPPKVLFQIYPPLCDLVDGSEDRCRMVMVLLGNDPYISQCGTEVGLFYLRYLKFPSVIRSMS